MDAKAYDQEQSERLARAVMKGDVDEVADALAKGADPDFDKAWKSAPWPHPHEEPAPLHMAFRRGDAPVAKALLDAGANFDRASGDGASMVKWLASGSGECAAHWIEAGGDPWKRHITGRFETMSLALNACRGGSAELWGLIVAKGPVPLPLARRHMSMEAWRGPNAALGPTVPEAALKWDNQAAIEALAGAGWIPSAKEVVFVAGEWMGRLGCKRRNDRLIKLCGRLFELGGPMPGAEELKGIERHLGAELADELRDRLQAAHVRVQAKAIARVAKAGRPGANKRRAGGSRL